MENKKTMISVSSVSKVFPIRDKSGKHVEEHTALKNISFDVGRGEFLTIVGPSGCGKSTLLDILAGLSKPTKGEMRIGDRKPTGTGANYGFVMQQYALFPWLSVIKNVEYGLRVRKVPKVQREETATKYLEMVGLGHFRNRYPFELSGGMKQRVSIARALAYDPDFLLMDEPFGALDAQTREVMQDELLRIWRETGKTIIFITHSIEEAVFLGTRVIVMGSNPGTIRECLRVDLEEDRQTIRTSEGFIRLCSRISRLLHGR